MLLFIQFYPLSLVSTRLHDKTFSVFYHVNVGILAGDNLFPLPVDNTVPVRVFGYSFDRFDEREQQALEKIAQLLVQQCDWNNLDAQ